MTSSVTVDGSLTVSDDTSGSYVFTDSGLGHVIHAVRLDTSPLTRAVDGVEYASFSRDAAALTLEFHIKGTSIADVYAKRDLWNAALFQLDYPVVHTVDGVSTTYSGGPCLLTPIRPNVDSGVMAQHFETYTVTIPFPNPNPS